MEQLAAFGTRSRAVRRRSLAPAPAAAAADAFQNAPQPPDGRAAGDSAQPELAAGTRLRVTFTAWDVQPCEVEASRVIEGVRQHRLRFADEPTAHWMCLDELSWERV
eukprot:2410159-Prymnesium_polylepis.1